MIVPLIFISYLVIYMIWDIKFSRASTILGALKAREPRTVTSLEGWLPALPSVMLGRVVGSGAYLKVESADLKNEIMQWQERQFRRSFIPMALFVLYILVCLIIRASINENT
jgi:hypothetical protein